MEKVRNIYKINGLLTDSYPTFCFCLDVLEINELLKTYEVMSKLLDAFSYFVRRMSRSGLQREAN